MRYAGCIREASSAVTAAVMFASPFAKLRKRVPGADPGQGHPIAPLQQKPQGMSLGADMRGHAVHL